MNAQKWNIVTKLKRVLVKNADQVMLSPVDSLTVLASNLKSCRTVTVLYIKIRKHEMTTESNMKGLSEDPLPVRLGLWHMLRCGKEPGHMLHGNKPITGADEKHHKFEASLDYIESSFIKQTREVVQR